GHTSAVHHRSLERCVTGALDTHVLAPEAGAARARTDIEGNLQARIRNAASVTAGDRLELVQGLPAAQSRAVFEDGSVSLDADKYWHVSAGAHASLTAGERLELLGQNRAELRQGGASIRLENDAVVIHAREIRLVVGGNEL